MAKRQKVPAEEKRIGKNTRAAVRSTLQAKNAAPCPAAGRDLPPKRSPPEPGFQKNPFITVPQDQETHEFFTHPIRFIKEIVVICFLTVLVVGVLIFFLQATLAATIIWVILTAIFLALAAVFRGYLSWRINIAFIKNKQLFYLRREGPLRHSLESVALKDVKFVDLEQKGFWQTFFDYGNIHIASMVAEGAKDITLTDIWRSRRVCSLLNAEAFAKNPK